MSKTRTMRLAKKDYSPVMCQRVVYFMQEGKTIAEFCKEEGISRQTFYDWKKRYPEFENAANMAVTFKQAYHLSKLPEERFLEIKNQEANKYYYRNYCGLEEPKDDKVNINVGDNKVQIELTKDAEKLLEEWKCEY